MSRQEFMKELRRINREMGDARRNEDEEAEVRAMVDLEQVRNHIAVERREFLARVQRRMEEQSDE